MTARDPQWRRQDDDPASRVTTWRLDTADCIDGMRALPERELLNTRKGDAS